MSFCQLPTNTDNYLSTNLLQSPCACESVWGGNTWGARGCGRGALLLGAFPRQRNQPIAVPGPQPRPWRCQLISPEAVRCQEFADLGVLKKFCAACALFHRSSSGDSSLCAGVSTGERLYNPRQCSETVRPWTPPFQPGRSQTSPVLCGLTPLRCHSNTSNPFISFFFLFFWSEIWTRHYQRNYNTSVRKKMTADKEKKRWAVLTIPCVNDRIKQMSVCSVGEQSVAPVAQRGTCCSSAACDLARILCSYGMVRSSKVSSHRDAGFSTDDSRAMCWQDTYPLKKPF